MEKIIFATNNAHKVEEIKSIIGETFEVISLKDAGIDIEIPEPHDTLEANATEKSRTIHGITGQNCFSEDTGLEVDALDGEPGVKSARYAGENCNFDDNIEKLKKKMIGNENRNARFRTVISLILNNTEFQFEGVCEGTITTDNSGKGGFGYDPVFIPTGSLKTFADMTLQEKNTFSHRQKATSKLVDFLSHRGKQSP